MSRRHTQLHTKTDETFAVVIQRYNQAEDSSHKRWYYLGSALFMYTNWQICTFLGLTIGRLIPDAASWGLDFAMVVTFIGMVIPYLKSRPMAITIMVSGLVASVLLKPPRLRYNTRHVSRRVDFLGWRTP